jgi:hypothetical protein
MTQRECRMIAEKTDGPHGCNLFIVFNGQKVAKRGYPGTLQARTWIPLEPGFAVYDTPDGGIVIEQNGTRLQ